MGTVFSHPHAIFIFKVSSLNRIFFSFFFLSEGEGDCCSVSIWKHYLQEQIEQIAQKAQQKTMPVENGTKSAMVWTADEQALVVKAANLFPAGTINRQVSHGFCFVQNLN